MEAKSKSIEVPERGLVRFGHLAALSAFAIAQPLFDLLGKTPEFFAARGEPGGDIVAFALVVTLVPPLLLFAIEQLVGLASKQARTVAHLVFVALGVTAIAVQFVGDAGVNGGFAAFTIAALIGIALATLYARAEGVRSFLSVLAAAPVVFLFLFLVTSPVSKIVFPGGSDAEAANIDSKTPVVWVIMDEVPVTTFLDGKGRVDKGRFPNLAALAGDSTWYRNTATVHQNTPYAVPAQLDARLPDKDHLPIAADHKQTVFQLFGGDYRVHAEEEATSVCPTDICDEGRPGFADRMSDLSNDLSLVYAHLLLPPDLERNLPSVSETFGDFGGGGSGDDTDQKSGKETRQARRTRLRGNLNSGRPGRFENWAKGIKAGDEPELSLKHTLFPHVPFQYVPSGNAYRTRPNENLPGLNSHQGFGVQYLVDEGWQRHLLQAGDMDRLIGVLTRRLEQQGIYDKAVVVVTSDHGVAFDRGHDRRDVRPGNVSEIAPVPFFIKKPRQHEARISDKPLRTIDVLPTIADVVGVKIPWKVDGRSALAPTVRAQRHRYVLDKNFKKVAVDTPAYAPGRAASLARKVALFGDGPWASLYRFGPAPQELGRTASSFAATPGGALRAQVVKAGDLAHVDPGSGFLPVHVAGTIAGGRRGGGRTVAVAVNGRVAATGTTFSLAGSGAEDFSVVVPDSALRAGRNKVEVLWLRGPGDTVSLGGTG